MKYLKRFLIVMVLLGVFSTFGLLGLWYNLEIIATPKIISALQKKWLPQASIDWDKFSIEVNNPSFYKKILNMEITSPTCLGWKKSRICLKEMRLIVTITLRPRFDYQIQKAIIVSHHSEIQMDDLTSPQVSSDPALNIQNSLLQYRSSLILVLKNRPDLFEFEFKNGQLYTNNEVHKYDLSLNQKNITLHYALPDSKVEFTGKWLELNNNKIDIESSALLSLQEKRIQVQLDLFSSLNGQNTINLKIYDKSDKPETLPFQHFYAQLDLLIQPEASQLQVQDIELKPDYGFDNLLGKSCFFSFYPTELKSTQMQCDSLQMTRLETQDLKRLKGNTKALKDMLSNLNLKIDGFLNEKNIFRQEFLKLGQVHIDAKSIQKGFLNLNLETHLDFYNSERKLSWEIKQLNAKVSVSSFQDVVERLKGSRFAIPMPFNTLNGDVIVHIKNLTSKSEQTKIQGLLDVKLKGEGNQVVDLTAQATYQHSFDLKIKPHSLKAHVFLDKVAFHLPPFDPLRGIPSIGDDSRISKKQAKSKTKILDYDISVQSRKKDSIQVYYKHFKPFLTASLSGRLNEDKTDFSFTVDQPFSISYLRRDVTIQNFVVENNSGKNDMISIDGRMIYEASGYLIFIDVLGDASSPSVKLTSQPSLPRDDIISLLLYKRTRSGLSSSQKQNVGGADSALTDRAIGLIGIWAFASTPIESVYYNSQNHSYQAVIALPGEIKLNVGTDWESTQFVGLRKRLSKRWSIETSYESGEEIGVGNIFLQREYSY